MHISSVIADSCIVFVPSAGSREEAISHLRAKEQVQAALAEAAAKKERQATELATREAAEVTSDTPGDGGQRSKTPWIFRRMLALGRSAPYLLASLVVCRGASAPRGLC
jgi:hypothetical protein